MDLNTKLKDVKREYELLKAETQLKQIYGELAASIKQGYTGKTFGFHISPTLGELLTNEGFGWETFTDGEFEESSVWLI